MTTQLVQVSTDIQSLGDGQDWHNLQAYGHAVNLLHVPLILAHSVCKFAVLDSGLLFLSV